MSKKYEWEEELDVKRKSPYDDMPPDAQEYEDEDDMIDPEDREYADEYNDAYDGEEEEEQQAGFFSTVKGKVLLGIVAALMIVLLALICLIVFGDKEKQQDTDLVQRETAVPQFTQAPTAIVFAPTVETTDEPDVRIPEATEQPQETPVPVIVVDETQEPTATPEPTQTPLPIILTNTPTPSPSPTASPTSSPSPSPTPSPKPTPTPIVDLANGVVNRDAKLRASASSSGKIKDTIKKGETVTIHEVLVDKDGKVWYAVTVDDIATEGYMRDYVVDVEGELPKPTATPKATTEPGDEELAQDLSEQLPEGVIATGRTNRDANMRKVMNGKVITTLRKGVTVEILSVRTDKSGNIWYEARQSGKSTIGFMRDYVVNLDDDVDVDTLMSASAPEVEAEETDTPSSSDTQSESSEGTIGQARTNRAANVRVKPVSGADLVRQLSKGNALNIFAKYEDDKGQIWYEVATESGKTRGFVRDYVINILNIDKDVEVQKYEERREAEEVAEESAEETEAEPEEETERETVRQSRFQYAGNKESMVFHELFCDLLPSSSKDLVYMENRDYAVNAGYTPCEICTP